MHSITCRPKSAACLYGHHFIAMHVSYKPLKRLNISMATHFVLMLKWRYSKMRRFNTNSLIEFVAVCPLPSNHYIMCCYSPPF